MTLNDAWVTVPGWRRFQHYDPALKWVPWIKTYTELTRNDDYLELTGHERAVLHGLWLEYCSTRCRLRLDTRSLSRRLNLRVTTATLIRLNQAGFIDGVSRPELAEGYTPTRPSRARPRPRQEVDTEQEPRAVPVVGPVAREAPEPDGPGITHDQEQELRAQLRGLLREVPDA